MNILLKQVMITDPNSPFNGKINDLLIEGSTISKIGTNLEEHNATVIDEPGLCISPGWVDCFAHFGDPGYEFRETIESGIQSAAAGGFTRVFTLPNTNPVIDNKSLVEYISKKSIHSAVQIQPIGAITQKIEGKELAEMYDMRHSGAVAFSDGLKPIQSPGLFIKALQYVKAFDGVLIQMPIDQSIGASGLMNEGIISTRLGLPGIPSIAEETMLRRDIELLKYTSSKLHVTGISTQQSLNLIRTAKKEGLHITCSVTPYHLFFCEEDLHGYDTYLKVNPPLRSLKDMMALRDGVLDGTVDCIASHHFPQDWDHKICEFEYAAFGMIGLQTSFAVVNHLLDQLTNDQLVKLFSLNARNIFNLPTTNISEGTIAELTIYHRKHTSLLKKEQNKSKSVNSAFMEIPLNGKVFGIINNQQFITN